VFPLDKVPQRLRVFLPYGLAVVSVALAIWMRLLLDPVLGAQLPFATLFFAVLLASWYGGIRPALLAVLLGGLAAEFFLLPPRNSFAVRGLDQQVALVLYFGISLGIALLGGAMQSARRTSEAGAKAVRRQAALIDQAYGANIVWDWNGPITFWNKGAERLYGFPRSEALGKVIYSLLSTVTAGGVATFLDSLEREGSWEGELVHTTRDGRKITVDSSMVLVREAGLAYVIEANRDITERRRAELALQEAHDLLEARVRERTSELTSANESLRSSEDRYRLLVEGVNDYAIFRLDPAGTVQTWNSGAERLTGFNAGEIAGKSYSSLFTPEDVAAGLPAQELARAAAEGKVEVEGWRVHRDGSRLWITGTLIALYDSNHVLKGFSKIARDLTERRRNDELLRSVLNHTAHGIVGIDENGIVTLFNPAAENIFHRTASEAIGANVKMLMPEPFQSEHDGNIADFLRTAEPKIMGHSRRVLGLRKDGGTFPMDLTVTEFFLGGRRQFVGLVEDISEKQKLEAQFYQSQKLEAVGQLAGGVAHDFNNLLTVISGYGEMIVSGLPDGHELRSAAEAILEAGDRAAGLTRQLLAFSRRTVLEPKVLDLNLVVTDMQRMLQRLLGDDIELTASLDPTIARVKVDPGQLGQLLMNLAVNARDAMPQGGLLTIETQAVELDEAYRETHTACQAGPHVMLALTDTGTGMSPEVKSHIFEPFFTTKGVGKGSGLGLAVVEGVVKQSGGSIEVYSEPGIGTTFKIYFPVAEGRADASGMTGVPIDLHGSETILLVEDNDAVRRLAFLSLQSYGYRILQASDGPQAANIAEQHQGRIDLLATDLVMPRMSGRELAQALLPRFPHMKVLYLSGYTDDAVVRHGILESDVNFLQKPFTPSSLANKVRQALDQSPSA
jgi:PAS domain S-box-containing protein